MYSYIFLFIYAKSLQHRIFCIHKGEDQIFYVRVKCEVVYLLRKALTETPDENESFRSI